MPDAWQSSVTLDAEAIAVAERPLVDQRAEGVRRAGALLRHAREGHRDRLGGGSSIGQIAQNHLGLIAAIRTVVDSGVERASDDLLTIRLHAAQAPLRPAGLAIDRAVEDRYVASLSFATTLSALT